MKFRKKPVVIDAIQFTGDNSSDVAQWAHGGWQKGGIWQKQKLLAADAELAAFFLVIPTLEGEMEAAPGDWIIRGVKGELYPCKPDIFDATYERCE